MKASLLGKISPAVARGQRGRQGQRSGAEKEGLLSCWPRPSAASCSVPGDYVPRSCITLSQDNLFPGDQEAKVSPGIRRTPYYHHHTHTHTHTHTHMLPDSVSMVSRASHALASAGKPQSRKLQVSNMNRGKKLPSKVGQKPQSCCPENVKWYLEVLMKLSFPPHPMTEPLHKMCWLIGV